MSLPAYAVDPDAVLKNVPEDVKWRTGIPNYARAHNFFQKHKTTNHKAGSLEDIVQNLVKNWEKEASHKTDPRQWDTVDLDNYQFSCNGLNKYNGQEMLTKGTYNALLGESMYYSASSISFEDSHDAFRNALGDGFAWELLEVFSGPPHVTFTWRHFGTMTNEFKCTGLSGIPYNVKPSNKMVEIFGMCKATVNDQLKIQDLQVFYDPNQLFVQLLETCPHAAFIGMKLPESANTDQSSATTEKSN
ncbi:unnamed protein product [Adineta ricciae]|uniref:Pathogen-related protein n=1 Tax=Adineta ricciae TaxID=249248 RepID=A0A813VLA9_ADIRI|nr:unnamed protein product [Adineta ricciae]CAF1174357.1 unnamed protein product [Adineta ricciae]